VIDFSSVCKEWAHAVTGMKLLTVKGVVYVYERPELEHPQQLQLIFSGIYDDFTFKCGRDGSSLEMTNNPLQAYDLGEYGKEVIIDLSSQPFFKVYLDKNLLKLFSIFSSFENTQVGIKLVFDGGIDLIIANIGDEISFFTELPLDYEQEIGIEYRLL